MALLGPREMSDLSPQTPDALPVAIDAMLAAPSRPMAAGAYTALGAAHVQRRSLPIDVIPTQAHKLAGTQLRDRRRAHILWQRLD
jgi:hypothetical protein